VKLATTPLIAALYQVEGHPSGLLETRNFSLICHHLQRDDIPLPSTLYLELPQMKFRHQCDLMVGSRQILYIKSFHTGLRRVPMPHNAPGGLYVGDYRKDRRDLKEKARTALFYTIPPVGLEPIRLIVTIFQRPYTPHNRAANAAFAGKCYTDYLFPRLRSLLYVAAE
jgi:hypothetical protein